MHEHQALLPVGTMVHPVVRCCVQDIAKRSQVTQQLCVDQELSEKLFSNIVKTKLNLVRSQFRYVLFEQ